MEEYKIEELIDIFSDHMVRAKKQSDDFIEKFRENNPNDPIPEIYAEDFNFPGALRSICSEILRLKSEIHCIKPTPSEAFSSISEESESRS